ncbi:YtpI family protein [Paenibacillus motobuensis]|uniref:YtpI-like protein n=1 Tax=Paenibacillus motobuensis TaxID=295324 RepID=A0ABN0Y7G5_9BACL
MVDGILYVVYAGLFISSICSIIFSLKARRSTDNHKRGITQAKSNISMGFMLLFLAIIQMFMFTGSTVRVVVGAVFMVLGAFNIFAGFRNYGIFSRQRAD